MADKFINKVSISFAFALFIIRNALSVSECLEVPGNQTFCGSNSKKIREEIKCTSVSNLYFIIYNNIRENNFSILAI